MVSDNPRDNCCVCKQDKHNLYCCTQFKYLNHGENMSILRANNICINCKPGHFSKQCSSSNWCKRCQRSHHTLLHLEQPMQTANHNVTITNGSNIPEQSTANVTTGLSSNTLLMTCQLMINAPKGKSMKARFRILNLLCLETCGSIIVKIKV